MSTPDNDVLKLYQEISQLRRLVEAQNKRVKDLEDYIIILNQAGQARDKELVSFIQNINFIATKFNGAIDLITTISELLPIMDSFFTDIEEGYKT